MKKNNNQYDSIVISTIVMLITSVLFLGFGLTFALYKDFFKGTTNNIIEAGRLAFSYDEDTSPINGINIKDALPISDKTGKELNGANQYFDFSVTSTATFAEIDYQIYVVKQENSTLPDQWVKVYLTEKNNNEEIVSPLVEKDGKVLSFQDLTGDNQTKLVYNGTVPISDKEYHKDFRLRIWLNGDLSVNGQEELFYGKSFSIKVKVNASEQ